MKGYTLEDVGFAYDEGPEVLSVDRLEIAPGSVTALVGPNGSGKSTLLQLLAFLHLPTRGTLRYGDEVVTEERLAALRRKATLLLQNPYLFRTTVLANVEWGLRVRSVPSGERRKRALAVLGELGLNHLAYRSAQQLSGGESQRVALARLLALEPEVVLLDEPTNHVDLENRGLIEETIRSWNRERGVTVVLATHDSGQAQRLADATWRLERGEVGPSEVENIFRGRFSDQEPSIFESGPLRLVVSGSVPRETRCLRLSPRDVVLAREPQVSSARNMLRGTIQAAEMNGTDEVRVTLECGVRFVVLVTARSWNDLGFTVGDSAVASFKATSLRAC